MVFVIYKRTPSYLATLSLCKFKFQIDCNHRCWLETIRPVAHADCDWAARHWLTGAGREERHDWQTVAAYSNVCLAAVVYVTECSSSRKCASQTAAWPVRTSWKCVGHQECRDGEREWRQTQGEKLDGKGTHTPPGLLLTLGVSENVAGSNERFNWWRSDYLLSSFHLFYSLIFYCLSGFHLCDQVLHGAAYPCPIPPLPQRRGSKEETGQQNRTMTSAQTDSIW